MWVLKVENEHESCLEFKLGSSSRGPRLYPRFGLKPLGFRVRTGLIVVVMASTS